MALSTLEFWDRFFEQRVTPPDPELPSTALDWYISAEVTFNVIEAVIFQRISESRSRLTILHNGCGSSEVGVMIQSKHSDRCHVMDGDFSKVVLEQMKLRFPNHDFLVIDAMSLPFHANCLDIIFCKGMFDSITADHTTRTANAALVMSEVARVLKSGGEYLIFSTFSPQDNTKDMLSLVTHPDLVLVIEEIPGAPFEIPGQPCSYLYRNRRRCRLPATHAH